MKNLLNADGLQTWQTKLNDNVIKHRVVESFWWDQANSYTPTVLDIKILGGSMRSGVAIVELADTVVTITNNVVNWIGVNTTLASEAIETYVDGSVPASEWVPLYKVTVDGSFNITEFKDVRSCVVR